MKFETLISALIFSAPAISQSALHCSVLEKTKSAAEEYVIIVPDRPNDARTPAYFKEGKLLKHLRIAIFFQREQVAKDGGSSANLRNAYVLIQDTNNMNYTRAGANESFDVHFGSIESTMDVNCSVQGR